MPEDKKALAEELMSRLDKFPADKQPLVRELALRYGVTSRGPEPADPTPSGGGFLDTAKDFMMNAPTRFMDFMTGDVNPISATLQHASEMGDRATELWKQGHKAEAGATALAGLIPGSGDEALMSGRDFGEGNIGGGIAHGAISMLPFVGGPALRGGARVAEALPEVAARTRAAARGAVEALPTARATMPAQTLGLLGGVMKGPKGAAIGATVGAMPAAVGGAVRGWRGYVPPLGEPPSWFMNGGIEPGGPITPAQATEAVPDWFLKGGQEPGGPITPHPSMEPVPDWFKNGGQEPGGEPYQLPEPPDWFMKQGNNPGGRIKPQPRVPKWFTEGGKEGPPPTGEVGPIQVHSPSEVTAITQRSTKPEGYVEPVNTWTNANRNLHAVIQQLELPDSPSGTKSPGMVSKIAKEVLGAKNGAGDLTPDQIDSITEYLVKYKKWPQKGDLK